MNNITSQTYNLFAILPTKLNELFHSANLETLIGGSPLARQNLENLIKTTNQFFEHTKHLFEPSNFYNVLAEMPTETPELLTKLYDSIDNFNKLQSVNKPQLGNAFYDIANDSTAIIDGISQTSAFYDNQTKNNRANFAISGAASVGITVVASAGAMLATSVTHEMTLGIGLLAAAIGAAITTQIVTVRNSTHDYSKDTLEALSTLSLITRAQPGLGY